MANRKLLPQSEPRLSGILSVLLTDSATTAVFSNPPDENELPTYFILEPDSDDKREKVRAVDVSGNIVTIERGVDNGGVGVEHQANSTYKQNFTAQHWDKVVEALEQGWLSEDAGLTITKVDANTIRIAGYDRTAYYPVGRVLLINGTVKCKVVAASYASSNTDIVIFGGTVPTTITSLKLLIGPVENPLVGLDDVQAYSNNSLFRQAIINGNFDIWQRGISFVAGANNDDVYTADCWNLISDGNNVFDVSLASVTNLPGSNCAIKLGVKTAKRGGIVQFLEAKDAQKFKGKTVSISFAVQSANISALRATVLSWASTADVITSDVVGTWGATPTWAANWADNATPTDLTVTSNWTTVKVEGIVLDEATVNNLALVIWTPNEETVGDIVYITQVQMNEGSVALPFMPKSYDEELRACCRYWKIGQLLGIANTTSVLAISSDFALNPLRTAISTSNFKLYTTKANAIAEVAQQALTTPGVGDTNITQSSYIVNEINGIIGLQLSGTPLTAGRAYSAYYVINQEL